MLMPAAGHSCNLNRLLNGAVKYMNAVTVDLSRWSERFGSELRAGLIHGQENARNLQIGVESILYITHHFLKHLESFTGEEVCLHRNDAVICCSQSINGQ